MSLVNVEDEMEVQDWETSQGSTLQWQLQETPLDGPRPGSPRSGWR